MTTPAMLEELLRKGMLVQFRRSVNYRTLCEIFHWDGTPLAFATETTPHDALLSAVQQLPDILPDTRWKPARRAYEELRKRGIKP